MGDKQGAMREGDCLQIFSVAPGCPRDGIGHKKIGGGGGIHTDTVMGKHQKIGIFHSLCDRLAMHHCR